MRTPPEYLKPYLREPSSNGPSRLLADGAWCGHGEPEFVIYDVHEEGEDAFVLILPSETYPALCAVSARRLGGSPFFVYDPRRHPASVYAGGLREHPYHTSEYRCSWCDAQGFRLSVGFEIPGDSASPEDTSWFALAIECVSCDQQKLVFDDETA
jgi:hypothetical protein